MRKLGSLLILGFVLLAGQLSAHAATPGSDWPALNYDAAQSNDNTVDHAITPGTFLKLKVRWTSLVSDTSYPVVAGGRVYVPLVGKNRNVHVRVLDAVSGKQVALFTKGAEGGMLASGGNLYLAGRALRVVDPSSGQDVTQINATPAVKGARFVNPVTDHRIVLAGYASPAGGASSLYAIDPQASKILWKRPSVSAQATIGRGRILTVTANGSTFYDESSGKALASPRSLFSTWFAGDVLAYTVASINRGSATLYAMDGTGHTMWKRVVGPRLAVFDWPHAVGPNGLYVATLKPDVGVEALDPESGDVLWRRRIADVQRIVLANNMLFVLTYGLGQPVRLIGLRADTGAVLGAVVLSAGYYAFPAANELMIADGMVFIRAVGPGGPQLVALGLKQ